MDTYLTDFFHKMASLPPCSHSAFTSPQLGIRLVTNKVRFRNVIKTFKKWQNRGLDDKCVEV